MSSDGGRPCQNRTPYCSAGPYPSDVTGSGSFSFPVVASDAAGTRRRFNKPRTTYNTSYVKLEAAADTPLLVRTVASPEEPVKGRHDIMPETPAGFKIQ